MIMKLNKLFLLAAMGLGLVACNDNDLVEGSGSNGAQAEGTTYVGLSLKFNASNTRATEDGTEAEQNIQTAYVVMTNTDGSTIEEVVALTDAKDGTESNVDKKCYVFQTTPGTHSFYAVVNPDVAPVKNGNIEEYFNTGVTLAVASITSTENGGNFMMASEDVLTAYLEDGVTEEEALAGLKNSYTINVERVSAKVTMTCANPALTDESGNDAAGTISDVTFNLKGGATMSYRMAQNTIEEIADNAWTYENLNIGVPTNDGDYNNATPVYCLENIHATGSYVQNNTTYLTLKTTFKPANVVNCDDPLGGLTSNTHTEGTGDELTFYVVKEGTLAGNYLMKADLESFQATEGNSDKYPEGVDELSGPYANGECWFGPIWIGQEDATDQDAPIVRNTWYNLNITGITLPGDENEPEPIPDEKLNPDTNVAITLTVMPWNFINRGITLQ